MDPQSLVIIFRMLERILGVGMGGLLIYFGYRLFLDSRSKRARNGGSGNFTIAGGNKIKLSKVGPGVFFALFGAGLILFSLTRSVSLTTSGPVATPAGQPAAAAAITVKFMGATSVPETDDEWARQRAETEAHIVALNAAVARATAAERVQLEQAVAWAKLAMMERLWAEDWGDLADFRDWLEKGGTPPAGTQSAVEFYQRE